jgi:hypothetical protein
MLASPNRANSGKTLQAYDIVNGKLLWASAPMAGGSSSPPITYETGGKQYVLMLIGATGSRSTHAAATLAKLAATRRRSVPTMPSLTREKGSRLPRRQPLLTWPRGAR